MKRIFALVMAVAIFQVAGVAQQQINVPGTASMTWAGTQNLTGVIDVQWASTVIGMQVDGAPNQPFMIIFTPDLIDSGLTGVGGINLPGIGILDLDVFGPAGFGTMMDGFGMSTGTLFDQLANTGITGLSNWTFPIPILANPTIGAFQALVGIVPGGPVPFNLTAASRVTITASQNLFLAIPGGGDDIFANIGTVFGSTDFYDVNYSDLFISSNGYVTFGAGTADFADGTDQPGTEATYDTGPPRVAPLYADFTPGVAISAGNLIFQYVENLSGWTVTWLLMDHYDQAGVQALGSCLTSGACNTFHLTYFYSDGRFEFDFTSPEQFFAAPFIGNLASDWGMSGITPGGDPLNLDPLTGLPLPLDPNPPLVPNYGDGTMGTPTSGDLVFYGGNGIPAAPTPMGSFRTDLLTSITASVSGTGAIVTAQPIIFGGVGSSQANSYLIF